MLVLAAAHGSRKLPTTSVRTTTVTNRRLVGDARRLAFILQLTSEIKRKTDIIGTSQDVHEIMYAAFEIEVLTKRLKEALCSDTSSEDYIAGMFQHAVFL